MSEKITSKIVTYTWEEIEALEIPEERYDRLRAMTDDDIDYSDDPPLTEDQRRRFKPARFAERFDKMKKLNRIDKKFQTLRQNDQKAFMPYICAGDPNLDLTHDLVLTLEDAGANLIELGIPFSDPIADGPTVQKASERALIQKTTLDKIFDLIAKIRQRSEIPITLMGYYNPIFVMGVEKFCETATSAGADGLIVPDLPAEEANDLIEIAPNFDLATVFLVAPTSTPDRMKRISEISRGFIYCVSLTGTTGARDLVSVEISPMIAKLRSFSEKPICVGFGVSNPDQARQIAEIADGVIIGSAVIREIEKSLGDPTAILSSVKNFATAIVDGMK